MASPPVLPYHPIEAPEIRLLTLEKPTIRSSAGGQVPFGRHLNSVSNFIGILSQLSELAAPNQANGFRAPNFSTPSTMASPPIAATLSHHRLDSSPPYVTLSYRWGDERNRRPMELGFPGRAGAVSTTVTANLHAALTSLRPLLQVPGEPTMPIWIDALCINQADEKEKMGQLAQMGRIYRHATRVYIFLQEDLPPAALGGGFGSPVGGPFVVGGGFGQASLGGSTGSGSGQAELGMRYAKRLARLVEPVSLEITALIKGRPETEWLALQHGRIKAVVRALLAAQPPAGVFGGPGPGSSDWYVDFAALRALFRQVGWWRRVWVVQELVLSRERILLLGNESCWWNDLRLTQQALMWMSIVQEEVVSDYSALCGANTVYHHVNVIMATTTHFSALQAMFWKSIDEAKLDPSQKDVADDQIGGVPLLDVLLTLTSGEKSLEATVPSDRIYGLLGMVRQKDKTALTGTKLSLPKLSVMVGTLLLEKYGPGIMAYCRPTEMSDKLPSWAPDMVSAMMPQIGTHTEPGREAYHASGNTQWVSTTLPATVCGSDIIISFRGVVIGAVAEAGSIFESWPEHPLYFSACRSWFDELARMVRRHGAANPRLVAQCLAELWRVPVADRSVTAREKPDDAFRRGFQALTSNAAGALFVPPALLANETFVYRRSWMVYGRRAFVDNAGRPGLGPKEARTGDLLVILAGAAVPFVVRGRGDGRFTMLGSVYVYGRMDGEAFPGEPSLIDIQLC